MKVRALPRWRNPVGDGANRTRGLEVLKSDADIVGLNVMVWGLEKHRQAEGLPNLSNQQFDRGALYLNPVVFTALAVKT